MVNGAANQQSRHGNSRADDQEFLLAAAKRRHRNALVRKEREHGRVARPESLNRLEVRLKNLVDAHIHCGLQTPPLCLGVDWTTLSREVIQTSKDERRRSSVDTGGAQRAGLFPTVYVSSASPRVI